MRWLDTPMIGNAKDAATRILALFYLLHERYQLDAAAAGEALYRDHSGDSDLQQTLDEVRAALQKAAPIVAVGWCSDAEARTYLAVMLAEYDLASSAPSSDGRSS